MCCSSHGASITTALQLQAAAPAPTKVPAPDPKRLRYLGQIAMSTRGPFSNRVYELALLTDIEVDASDLQALLRTGLFERV